MFFPGDGFPFPGMDGGPPGRGGPGRDVDKTKLYKLLEVEKNASESEIKKAYKKLALQHHPDKGGDPEKFKEISGAYEVLSNSDKRAKYDREGEVDCDFDPFDVFNAFFNNTNDGRRQKTNDVVQSLKVTLEQIYNGHTRKMAITRQVIDKQKGVQQCDECDGRGKKMEFHLFLGQHMAACASCNGQGKTLKTKKEQEELEVHVQKGSPDGHKIVRRAMADEHPHRDTGDVVFVVKEEAHEVFKRNGADLFIEKDISLVEALCGFEMKLTHLDGRKLLIKTSPGEIIKPMMNPLEEKESKMERLMKAVKGEGMPTYKNPSIHGNLFLIFNIKFPAELAPATQQILRDALPPPLNQQQPVLNMYALASVPSFSAEDPSVEVRTLTEMDPVQSLNSNKAYEADEQRRPRRDGSPPCSVM